MSKHAQIAAFALVLSCSSVSATFAQSTTAEVAVDSVTPDRREISVSYSVGSERKTITLDVSRKAEITLNGKPATIDSLGAGQKATIEYDKKLEVVTKIAATGTTADWLFLQLGKAAPDTSYLVSSDGGLLCFQEAGYAIQSGKSFEQVKLSLEFRYTKGDRISKNGGAIVIGAKSPDFTSTDWAKRIPLGFELKLAPGQAGDVILPSPTFKSELPLGQKREGRRVSRTQAKEFPAGQWNKLEVETDDQNGLTVKLNGDVVNKLAKAESVTGRIVIWPLGSEMQFRNAVAKIGDTEEKLAFDRIEKPK